MLGEMTASISHEVNQPLGAILSNADAAEMLLELPSPPLSQIRQILKDIRRDDLRASAVIQRVRGLVGRQDVQRVPICINDVLVDTLGLVTHDSKRRGVTLVQDLAPNLPETQADPIMLQQVILNLLLNAMDAMSDTPVGSRRIILRSALSNEGKLELSVEDCGHGIPAEKLGRVFDSFFTTKEHGMGLGLALARSIAEAHGGRLVAKNNPSGGTTFYLVLPINPSA
jgi:signal transduction histidine kinase